MVYSVNDGITVTGLRWITVTVYFIRKSEDWNAEGGELWLIDLLAPFGGQEAVLKELKDKVFEGQPIKTLQPAPNGSGVAVVEW